MNSVLKEVNKVCPQVADSMTDLTAQHANCTSVSTQASAELANTVSGTSEELTALREQVSLQPQLILLYLTPPPAFKILKNWLYRKSERLTNHIFRSPRCVPC